MIWIEELKSKFYSGISNFFIITGNINDYPAPNYMFEDYLVENLFSLGIEEVFNTNLGEGFPKKYVSRMDYIKDVVCSTDKKRAMIVTFPEFLFPNLPIDRMTHENSVDYINFYKIINSKDFIKSDNIIIFLTESKYSINEKLLGANTKSTLLEVGFPNESKRLNFLKYLKKTSSRDIKYEVSLEDFSKLTAGLTLVGVEDIYLQGEVAGILKREYVIERKKELISKEYGEVIEVLDSDGFSFDDFAGQEQLKSYHREVIINPMMSGEVDIVPKGLLYTGPPGTGKTHFARCLSGEAGINFVELKMSKILDKWVGESEKRFDKALTCIKSIAPVGVFIDEIDQAFSRGDNDSNSVNKNLFGMFLTILSDPINRGKIIWIGAANYPNKLDEALKRTGRFDKKMPFLPPCESDRRETLKVHLNRSKLSNQVEKDEFDFLSKEMKGYTQAEIEGIVTKALELVMRRREDIIFFKDLKRAIELTKPTQNKKIDEMIKISIDECNDIEFLPMEAIAEYKKSVDKVN